MPAETHSTHEPVTPDEVFAMVRGHLAEILEVDDDTITLDSTFADDLNADSLALIELVEALEEDLGEQRRLPAQRRTQMVEILGPAGLRGAQIRLDRGDRVR